MKVPLVVTEFLSRARTLYPDAIGAVCQHERLSYYELAARIDRFSAALVARGVRKAGGVGKGDVVAYLSSNCPRLLEAYYAVPQMGAILLPINIRLTSSDISFILRDAGACAVVVDRALAGLLKPALSALPDIRTIILMGGDEAIDCGVAGEDYEAVVSAAPADFSPPNISEDDVAELFYT